MHSKYSISTAKFGLALAATGLLALSACEQRPYPAPSHSASPPAAPTAQLMGAPESSPYTAPPVVQAPDYAPPPAYARSPSYDSGSVVAMAPIPNPGDAGSGPFYDGHHNGHRIHVTYPGAGPAQVVATNTVTSPYGEGHPAPGHPLANTYVAPTPSKVTTAQTSTTTTVVTHAAAPAPSLPPLVADNASKAAHEGVSLAAAVGAAAGVAALEAKHATTTVVKTAKTTVATATTTASTAQSPVAPSAPSTDRATSLASLQTALTDAVGKTAVLTTPGGFTPNQQVDVSLTIPAGFGDTLHSEAQKDGLGDAAASVSVTALLSGNGFAVSPDDIQSAPLVAGQPNTFHWTVTAQPGAKGPLHADVGADLLGGGSEKLALGSVQKTAGTGVTLTPKVVGAGLLFLIAALVVAWLARGRGPTRSARARRASRLASKDGRPLDMTSPREE